jgi:antitoxin HicB
LTKIYKLPLVLTAKPEGGYTVSSPGLAELVTEGEMLEDALAHVRDALAAVVELYGDMGESVPSNL